MVPFKEPHDGRFFVCEKMGLDIAFLGGYEEPEAAAAGAGASDIENTLPREEQSPSSRAEVQPVDAMMYT